MGFFVYILKCSDDSFYTGCTNNLEKRVHEHNFHKKGAKYTKTRRPVVLVYTEEHETLAIARAREAHIKTWKRSQKEKLLLGI